MKILILLISFYFLINCSSDNMKDNNKIDFAKELDNNLQLIIYYTSLNTWIDYPISVDEIKEAYKYKVIVNTRVLRNYFDRIEKINTLELEETNTSYFDLRIYCEIINKYGIIYSFGIERSRYEVLVNGKYYKGSEGIFYDIVFPFIPHEAKGFPGLPGSMGIYIQEK